MKSGYFLIAKECLDWPDFKEMYPKMLEVFREVGRKEIECRAIKIYGESDLFDDLPDGEEREYIAIFNHRLKVFVRFDKTN